MVKQVDSGSPEEVQVGQEVNIWDANYGALNREGVPVELTKARFDLNETEANAEVNMNVGGSAGALCFTAKLVEIEGNPSSDMEVTIDSQYKGHMQTNLAGGGAELSFVTFVADHSSAPDIIDTTNPGGKEYILDYEIHYDHDIGPLDTDSVQDTTDKTYYVSQSDISDGDVLRIGVGARVVGTVDVAAATAESDAFNESGGADNFPGKISYGNINISWD